MKIKKRLCSLMLVALIPGALCGNSMLIEKEMIHDRNLKEELEKIKFEYTDINLKNAKDFAGVEYLIGENKNGEGYFIYNSEQKIVTEYSYVERSPYLGYDSDLYYGGAAAYFVSQDNNSYLSLMDEKIIYKSDIMTNCKAYKEPDPQRNIMPLGEPERATTVDYPEFFNDKLRNNCGYFPGGNCGFIALGMIVAYADRYKNDNLMDNIYYHSYGGLKDNNESIGKYLYDLHPKDSTTSMHIKETMNIYVETRNAQIPGKAPISITYSSRYTPFYSANTIFNTIGHNTPVILFGNFSYSYHIGDSEKYSTGNHALVAYGVEYYGSSGYYWRCHLGWDWEGAFSDVFIVSGMIGSLYYFDLN